MNEKHPSLIKLAHRLLKKAAVAKGMLTISTLANILNSLSHISLMSFGVLMILCTFGRVSGTVSGYAIGMAVSAVGIFVFRYIDGYISHSAAYMLLADMRVKMYRSLRKLAPACLVDREKGDILAVAVGDIETIEHFFAHTIGPVFTVFILPLATMIAAAFIHPLFVAVLLPVYLLNSAVLPAVALRAGRDIGKHYREDLGELKSLILESVTGIRDIQIFCDGERQKQRILSKTREISKSAHALILFQQAVTSIPTFFIYVARIMFVLVAHGLTARTVGQSSVIIVFSFIVSSSFSSTQGLLGVVSSLIETFAAAERIFAIEDAIPEIVEDADPLELDHVESIRFENVCFGYDKNAKTVLENVSFDISSGEKIGIMGESGAGKSTLLRLLLRFWNPTSGEIYVNDIPISRYSLESLHRQIGELEQETFLFNDTIAENIAVGKPNAQMREIQKAAEQAGIADLIETLPQRYETQMGEMGDRLSGGEKQRIGIARLLLSNPSVIVMDEPTSNLDILREEEVLKTLRETCQDKIVIIVSHRMSTLSDSQRILKCVDGHICEEVPR